MKAKVIINQDCSEIKKFDYCAVKEALKKIKEKTYQDEYYDLIVDFSDVEEILEETIKKIKYYKG